jgi:hypothetical protein
MVSNYICPMCRHEFEQGEYNYNYDRGTLDFTCPCCGWYGTDSEINYDDDEDEDDVASFSQDFTRGFRR